MILKTTFLNSPAIFFCLDAGYWDSRKSASLSVHLSTEEQVSNGDAMWTCFRYFLCYLRLGSFATEGIDAESPCTGGSYAANAFSAVGACIKGAGSESNSTEGAYTESVCIRGVG